MKPHAFIKDHWKGMATVVFAVAVYCFWYFCYPHLMAWREQSQLFLCNKEYLLERLAIPGGLAQYIAEALVQFFANARQGALIYAVLFALMSWLTWMMMQQHQRVLKSSKSSGPWFFLLSFVPTVVLCWLATNPYVSTTPLVAVVLVLAAMVVRPKRKNAQLVYTTLLIPVGYWLVGPAVLLVALCNWRWAVPQWVLLAACVVGFSYLAPFPLRQQARGIDYYWEEKHKSTLEEMKYDRWMRMGKWARIVDAANKETPEALSSKNVVQLALKNLNRISAGDLMRTLDPSKKVMNNMSGAFIMSEVFFHIGMVNMSQRAAFETMESIPNYNKSGRALKRLTETAIITGQYEIALKYIAILEETITYRKWAKTVKPLAEHPETISQNAFYQKMRKLYEEQEDFFFY
ncbi:MAG: hypothetical protein J5548_01980 [Prevotella sp.]|nr:hypothetical protein [Prevotella sp.]